MINKYIISSNKHWNALSKRSKNFDSFKVYVIQCFNEHEDFIKIGKTFKTVNKRYSNNTVMPYNYVVLKEIKFNTAQDCFKHEYKLHQKYKNKSYTPNVKFSGHTECFKDIKI